MVHTLKKPKKHHCRKAQGLRHQNFQHEISACANPQHGEIPIHISQWE